MSGKLCIKRPIGNSTAKDTLRTPTRLKKSKENTPPKDDIYLPTAEPGQHFHVGFGFIRGSDYDEKDNENKTITSRDGKRAYLIIVDGSSRYTWIYLTSSKSPPIEAVRLLLNKFKSTNTHRTVRVNQGGELGKSQQFKNMIGNCGFALELTGSEGSAQNGIAENPNKTFAQMMRCILYGSELGSEYWSWALQHAVYIKNRLLHYSINMSPYEKFTGMKPDLSHLRVFGCKVYAKNPGKRKFKLDNNTSQGYFLGYAATSKNINYIDLKSGKTKLATHVIFDEAHMTTPTQYTPIAGQTLQRLGYYSKEIYQKNEIDGIWTVDTNIEGHPNCTFF